MQLAVPFLARVLWGHVKTLFAGCSDWTVIPLSRKGYPKGPRDQPLSSQVLLDTPCPLGGSMRRVRKKEVFFFKIFQIISRHHYKESIYLRSTYQAASPVLNLLATLTHLGLLTLQCRKFAKYKIRRRILSVMPPCISTLSLARVWRFNQMVSALHAARLLSAFSAYALKIPVISL